MATPRPPRLCPSGWPAPPSPRPPRRAVLSASGGRSAARSAGCHGRPRRSSSPAPPRLALCRRQRLCQRHLPRSARGQVRRRQIPGGAPCSNVVRVYVGGKSALARVCACVDSGQESGAVVVVSPLRSFGAARGSWARANVCAHREEGSAPRCRRRRRRPGRVRPPPGRSAVQSHPFSLHQFYFAAQENLDPKTRAIKKVTTWPAPASAGVADEAAALSKCAAGTAAEGGAATADVAATAAGLEGLDDLDLDDAQPCGPSE